MFCINSAGNSQLWFDVCIFMGNGDNSTSKL